MSIAAVFLLAATAPAQTRTWDQGSGSWDTTTTNWSGSTWTNGNTAVFGGTPGSTISIDAAGISATGVTFNVNGDTISASSANTLSLTSTATVNVGSTLTATISAPLAGTAGVQVEGGGTLSLGGVSTIDGGGSGTLGLVVGSTSANNTVTLNGGSMGIQNSTNRRSLYVGNSTFGGNSVTISTPGSSSSPSFNVTGNGAQVRIGGGANSSNNSLLISNGAYIAQTGGGGTNTWTIGGSSGANSNSMTVTGSGSQVVHGSNQMLEVGSAGSSNSLTVSSGGYAKFGRLGVGTAGGQNNFVRVTGSGSQLVVNTGGQPIIQVGLTSGSTGNYIQVDNGGNFNTGTGAYNRGYVVGAVANANNNYVLVTGSGSTFTVTEGMPLSFGGTAGVNNNTHTITDSTATGNHFDVFSGASTVQNSLYIMGADSAFNLGNGVGVSTATVNNSTGSTIYGPGVTLYGSGTRMNINSGRLIAGVDGSLVTGPGQINLAGPAYFSTEQPASAISSVITGTGNFTKEGAGLLILSGANSYIGDTSVLAGTLRITSPFLADAKDLYLTSGKLDLSFTAGTADTINTLYLGGVPVTQTGTWGATGSGAQNINDTYFSGTGMLNVSAVPVPEPETMVLLGAGLAAAGFLRRRRHA
jgi:autotransporter-associated beta strand protein